MFEILVQVTLAQLTEEVKEQEAQHLRGAVESTGKRGSGKRGSGKRDLGNRGSGPIVESVADRERGAADSTGKSESGLEKVPGWELRPGAPKMQLRPKEEALLPLVRQASPELALEFTCNWASALWLLQLTQAGQPMLNGTFCVFRPCGYLTHLPTSVKRQMLHGVKKVAKSCLT